MFAGATENTVEFNESKFNGAGIVLVPIGPGAVPVFNTINDNVFRNNTDYDVGDFEPVCFYNTWLNNTYDTVHPDSGSCFP